MTATLTRPGDAVRAERDSFGQLLHAEWTKFRTVRGWVIGMIVGGLLIIAVNLIPGGQCGVMQANGQPGPGGPGCALTPASSLSAAAVVEGRDHHQGEHPPGVGLLGDDGHRQPRGPDAVGLHPGHARPGRRRL